MVLFGYILPYLCKDLEFKKSQPVPVLENLGEFGPFCGILGYLLAIWGTLDCLGSYWGIWNCVGAFGAVLGYFGDTFGRLGALGAFLKCPVKYFRLRRFEEKVRTEAEVDKKLTELKRSEAPHSSLFGLWWMAIMPYTCQ